MNKKLCCAITLIILGVIFVALGIFGSFFILNEIQEGVEDAVKIKTESQDAEDFNDWRTNTDADDARRNFDYYVYNTTNVEAIVTTGAIPNVEELGPYSYREFCTFFNIYFTPNVVEVTWEEYCYKVFMADRSVGAPTDVISTIWATYFGVMLTPGVDNSESNLFAGAVFPVIAVTLTTFAANNIPSPSVDAAAIGANTLALFENYGTGLGSAPGIASVPGAFDGTLAAPGLSAIPGQATTGIYVEYAKWMFIVNSVDVGASGISLDLATTQTFFDQANGVSNPMLSGLLISLYAGILTGFAGDAVGLGTYNMFFSYIPQATARRLIEHSFYFANQFFGRAIASQGGLNYGGAQVPWNLGVEGSHRWVTTNVQDVILGDTQDDLVFATTGRVVAFSLFSNDTSMAAADDNDYNTTINTGQGIPDNIDLISVWRSMTVLPQRSGSTGFWNGGDLPVSGRYTPQFRPGVANWLEYRDAIDEKTRPVVWNSDVLRPIVFEFAGETSVEGIDLLRYQIADSVLGVDHFYDQFYVGVGNFTAPRSGVPILATQPRFLGADIASFASIPTGMPAIDPTLSVFIDMEQRTGAFLRGALRLQINMFLDADLPGTPNVDVVHPIMYLNKNGQLSASNAADFKDQINDNIDLARYLLYGGVAAGLVFILFGVGLVTYLSCSKSSDKSTLVDDY